MEEISYPEMNIFEVSEMTQEIAQYLTDEELSHYCQTSVNLNKICNNDIFWQNRTLANPQLVLLLPYRSLFNGWKDFYQNVRREAYYLFVDSFLDKPYIYSNIHVAYQALLASVEILSQLNQDKSADIFKVQNGYIYKIIIVFKDRIITNDMIDDYTLFSTGLGENSKINPNILDYPQSLVQEDLIYFSNKTLVAYAPGTIISNKEDILGYGPDGEVISTELIKFVITDSDLKKNFTRVVMGDSPDVEWRYHKLSTDPSEVKLGPKRRKLMVWNGTKYVPSDEFE